MSPDPPREPDQAPVREQSIRRLFPDAGPAPSNVVVVDPDAAPAPNVAHPH